MDILAFDLCGKFAHFRKYYSNSTALSFSLPPRTTLMGLCAGLLGKPRDSYYEEFSSERLHIGISIRSLQKKTFHRMNHLKVESPLSDLAGAKGHTQTPFEVISPLDVRSEHLRYRVFLAAGKEESGAFEQIKAALTAPVETRRYAPSLGTAQFTGWLENVRVFSASDVEERTPARDEIVEFHSALPSDNIIKIDFERLYERQSVMIEEEMLPADFVANNNRELRKLLRMMYTTGGVTLRACVSRPYFALQTAQDSVECIQFLE